MADFIGRVRELELLDDAYRQARSGRGSFVWITGRRRIGKSRLVEQFLSTVEADHVFFSSPKSGTLDSVARFARSVRESSLASAGLFEGIQPDGWRAALRLASTGATADRPAVIVVDEFPYLCAADGDVDTEFQHSWDRELERSHVLLICIGSDLSMMERLLEHDRPLHGRPTMQLRVSGLSPREVADLAGLDAAAALDAYLIVGGFPALAREWRSGASRRSFLKRQLESSRPLVTNGERILDAELPADLHARGTLQAIGDGNRTFTNILRASGLPQTTLNRSLGVLVDGTRLVDRTNPMAVPPGKDTRYMVEDPFLRFWLRFIGPHVDELDRGRADLVLERIDRGWESFRGSSIEPVVRTAVSRLLVSSQWGGARDIGSFWTRSNDPEIDLVGIDDLKRPRVVGLAGSIKWRERSPFDRGDVTRLVEHRAKLPGAGVDTLLLGVSRSGFDAPGLDVQLSPDDLLDAWA